MNNNAAKTVYKDAMKNYSYSQMTVDTDKKWS